MKEILTPSNIAMIAIIGILFICFLSMLYMYFEAKEEEKELRRMFYTPEEKAQFERPVRRFNPQLDEIEQELIELT